MSSTFNKPFIKNDNGLVVNNTIDYTSFEADSIFLEGTGGLLLDRVHKKAYCALSARADKGLFLKFCEDLNYVPIFFIANQTVNNKRLPIYHTNVMMCLAETFAVICLDTIDDIIERENVIEQLKNNKKEIIEITEAQMHQFAGNMLQLRNDKNQRYLVMSAAAHNSLTSEQINRIEKHCFILSSSLETIETCGGGSARCMIAEVFLPKK